MSNVFSWRMALRWTALIVAFKLFIFGLAYLLVKNAGQGLSLCTWDCGYYRGIAETGYAIFDPHKQSNLGFYPGFPLVVGFFMKIFGTSFGATGIVLNLFFYGAMVLVGMRWVWALGLRDMFYLPFMLWACDRYTLWSHVPYTESLFMLIAVSFLLLIRKQKLRKIIWVELLVLPLVAGALSGMRLVGISAIAAWGWGEMRMFLQRPIKGVWILLLGLWGFLAFCIFNYYTQGDWSLSFQATKAWGRHFDVMGIFKNSWHLLRFFYFPTVPVIVFSVWALGKNHRGFNFNGVEKWFFSLLLLLPLVNSIPLSTTRYFSVLLPAYVFIGYVVGPKLRSWPRFHLGNILLALFILSESYWQVQLTMKYFRAEAFNWLN